MPLYVMRKVLYRSSVPVRQAALVAAVLLVASRAGAQSVEV